MPPISQPLTIRIEGLTEYRDALKRLNRDMPKVLRVAFSWAAGEVKRGTQAAVVRDSGAARRSVRMRATQTSASVIGGQGLEGGYYPWLEFGGRVGINRSVVRKRLPGGRYMYPAYAARRIRIFEELENTLIRAAQEAGMEVTDG